MGEGCGVRTLWPKKKKKKKKFNFCDSKNGNLVVKSKIITNHEQKIIVFLLPVLNNELTENRYFPH